MKLDKIAVIITFHSLLEPPNLKPDDVQIKDFSKNPKLGQQNDSSTSDNVLEYRKPSSPHQNSHF